jgi:hypothetical protein
MSAFETWFIAQHGRRPCTEEEDMRLRCAMETGDNARATLQAAHEWDVRFTSALYAWQIKDDEK